MKNLNFVSVNVSMDGSACTIAEKELDGVEEDLCVTSRPIEPVHARFVRLVPITDRKMPVCLRAELFGCYRTDYPVSVAPPNPPTDLSFLKNGIMNDWQKFSGGGSLTMQYTWLEVRKTGFLVFLTLVVLKKKKIKFILLDIC